MLTYVKTLGCRPNACCVAQHVVWVLLSEANYESTQETGLDASDDSNSEREQVTVHKQLSRSYVVDST